MVADTGDVRFVCLERKEPEHSVEVEVTPESPDTETASNRRSSATSTVSGSSHGLARKRIIYAHSDILKRRSDYFTTMLTSSFSESATTGGPHERRIYTIVVEEADFVTIYWLLKWVYGNWLLFREHDDPKLAVEGVGGGWSAKTLSGRGRGDEWEWKAFSKGNFESTLDGSDTRSIASSEGVPSVRGNSRASAGKAKKSFSSGANQTSSTMRSPVSTRPRLPSTSKAPTSPVRPPPSPTRRSTSAPSNAGNPSTLTVPAPPPVPLVPNPRSNNPAPITASPTATTFPSSNPHYPISPRQQRQRTRPSLITTSDPHPHPSPPPTPASALAMYQVAHRYSMPGLAALALEHMMSTITPQSSFALLLATSTWDELHTLVEVSFVVVSIWLGLTMPHLGLCGR